MRDTSACRSIVAINRFTTDTEAEVALLPKLMDARGVPVVLANHWADGGAGAEDLARAVVAAIDKSDTSCSSSTTTTCRCGTR